MVCLLPGVVDREGRAFGLPDAGEHPEVLTFELPGTFLFRMAASVFRALASAHMIYDE
jgi:hypothetical protein